MPDGPLVSVVIPSFNRSAKLTLAVDSVRAQTHADLEIIVVDDGSTDDSFDVATRLITSDPRLRVLRHDANAGAQAARNTGIRAATGEWVAFLDSDDKYLPDSIERRLATAQREGTSAIHGECLAQSKEAKWLFGVPAMAGDIRRAVLERPGPMFQALLVRAELLRAMGELDESLVAYQEWDTAIRLSTLTQFSYLAEPTFIYDLRGSDTISRDARRSVRGYEQVIRRHFREMLRSGGLRVIGAHFREAARQHALGGSRGRALSRLVLGGIVWPFATRELVTAAWRLIKRTD